VSCAVIGPDSTQPYAETVQPISDNGAEVNSFAAETSSFEAVFWVQIQLLMTVVCKEERRFGTMYDMLHRA